MFLSNFFIQTGAKKDVSLYVDSLSGVPLDLCGLDKCFVQTGSWSELPLRALNELKNQIDCNALENCDLMLVASNLEQLSYGSLKEFRSQVIDLGFSADIEIITFYECVSLFKALEIVQKRKRPAILLTLDSTTLPEKRSTTYCVFSDTSLAMYAGPEKMSFTPYEIDKIFLDEDDTWDEKTGAEVFFSAMKKFRYKADILFENESYNVMTSMISLFLIESTFSNDRFTLDENFEFNLREFCHCRNSDPFIQWEVSDEKRSSLLESMGNGFYAATIIKEVSDE